MTRPTIGIGPVHRVAVVAAPQFIPYDLAVPCETFARARDASGEPAYEVQVCGLTSRVATAHFVLQAPHGLDVLERADTVVLPGVADLDLPVSRELVRAVRNAAERGARVISLCTGAFLLAATGLLAGRRATTHWAAADELARRHPSIDVDPDVLFVDLGGVASSAGASAGLDLCLHLVRRDLGAAAAARAARLAVVPLEREGGQAQFIERPAPDAGGGSLSPLLHWIEEHLDDDLSLDALARRAATSRRSLTRRFREQTGTPPAQWVNRARIRRAQELLETSADTIERIGRRVGFIHPATFRSQFRRRVGQDPTRYRRMFRTGRSQPDSVLPGSAPVGDSGDPPPRPGTPAAVRSPRS